MHLYWMDLHVHTVLSPCAELEMGAADIVGRCLDEGIDIIAIADHNAAANSIAVINAAKDKPLTVLPALEVQSREDIHTLCLFKTVEEAFAFQDWVWARLAPVKNDPDLFGFQLVIDHENNILEEVDTLLLQGIDVSVDDVIEKTKCMGGMAILAHVDRPAYSYLAVLGMLHPNMNIDAVELSARLTTQEALYWKENVLDYSIIRSSDAHRLNDIQRCHSTPVYLEEPSFNDIFFALHRYNDRMVKWPWS
ncbi:histidinol-phosphatase [Acetomicrobium sp. UBA5826]|uniref:histidinol-phosphatase n=1 Tax=Acetomicrobium sp. UBA5826 TaxID=1946039 RepID=UPI00257C9D71|nr:histidinol-phosphatase [Acetomicrobium sp. UBA5826]